MDLKKRCPHCERKIDRKFNFCPWCGRQLKDKRKGYGFLGKNDFEDNSNQLTQGIMPMGNIGNIVNSLMKQLDKEMQNMDGKDFLSNPRGFSIKIQRGQPQIRRTIEKAEKEPILIKKVKVSDKEIERRSKLKKKDALSKVRRLSDKIVYEIDTPGIEDESQVVITELEKGLEIKVYAKDYCYVKVIPLKMKVSKMDVSKGKLIIEFID